MSRPSSTALPTAYVVLRILIILNWIYAAVVLAILRSLGASPQWTLLALGVPKVAQSSELLWGLRAIALLGLAVPLNLGVLQRLVGIVRTVRAGDPFLASNAYRLQAIAWFLLAQQVVGLIVAGIGKAVSTPSHTLHLDAGFSPGGWLAVIMTFVLARVFAEGTLMRATSKGPSEMAIVVRLDELLYQRRMTLTQLAERVDITLANLSILKTGKARAIRFSTLAAICQALACNQPTCSNITQT